MFLYVSGVAAAIYFQFDLAEAVQTKMIRANLSSEINED